MAELRLTIFGLLLLLSFSEPLLPLQQRLTFQIQIAVTRRKERTGNVNAFTEAWLKPN